jgi:hypothetical protein
MKNTLWDVADTIVKRIATAIKTDPKEAKSFLEEISKEYWFDYLEEELDKPPTLRPMSGVKFGSAVFLLESENKINSWQDGYFCGDKSKAAVILDQGGRFDKGKDFKGIYGQIKGWLPSLPNPNEIKLP